jgi:hypothetical protein
MAYGPKPRDITGEKFNRLLVLKFSHRVKTRRFFLCKCDCGSETIGRVDQIISGHKRSCGCVLQEREPGNLKHGMNKSGNRAPEYGVWCKMLQRCNNPNDPKYPDYGGRGIKICKRWRNFIHFFKDMGFRPSKNYSLGRINNDGNYQPKNCRWETAKQQANNRRKPKPYTHHPNSLSNLIPRRKF